MKYLRRIIVLLIIFFVLFWLSSLLKCEINTYKHSEEFRYIGDIGDKNGNIKVLNYNDNFARVYWTGKYNGNIFTYIKHNNNWFFESWERTVWSSSGSADGFVWPYIR